MVGELFENSVDGRDVDILRDYVNKFVANTRNKDRTKKINDFTLKLKKTRKRYRASCADITTKLRNGLSFWQ